MNLGDIYTHALELLGKDQNGGYLSPQDFNNLLPWVNVEKLNQLIKVFEEKQEISRDLMHLVVTAGSPSIPPITLDDYGYGEYPSDYYYTARGSSSQFLNSCGAYTEEVRMVQFLNQQDFGYRISTSLLYPTKEEPIAVDENNKFLVRPKGIQSVALTYIKLPDVPYFDYDIIGDEVVYLPPNEVHVNSSVLPAGTPSESVEFEYPQAVYPDLANLVVQMTAIKIRSEFNLQTSKTDQGA